MAGQTVTGEKYICLLRIYHLIAKKKMCASKKYNLKSMIRVSDPCDGTLTYKRPGFTAKNERSLDEI